MLSKLCPMNERKVKFLGKKSSIYNKEFEYLLDNDPEKVVSKYGVKLRKRLNPALRLVAGFGAENKIHVERKAKIPNDKPIIFAPTHGFRDDISATINKIKRHAYLLYASLPHFYYTFEAIALWLNGCAIIDRKDKESKRSAVPKMARVIDFGADVIWYPEGVWNKTPNLLVQDLYHGIYMLAKEKNALVVPMALYEVNGVCHVIFDEPMDIGKYSCEEGLKLLRDRMAISLMELMMKYAPITKRSDIGDFEEYQKKFVDDLAATAKGFYDAEIENTAQFHDKSKVSAEEVFAPLENVEITQDNAYALCYRKR